MGVGQSRDEDGRKRWKRKLVLPYWTVFFFAHLVGGCAAAAFVWYMEEINKTWHGFVILGALWGGAYLTLCLMSLAKDRDRLFFLNDRAQSVLLSVGGISLPPPGSSGKSMHVHASTKFLSWPKRIAISAAFALACGVYLVRTLDPGSPYEALMSIAAFLTGLVLFWALPDGGAWRSLRLFVRGLAGGVPDQSTMNNEVWGMDFKDDW